jgi:hypothetical protein
MNDEQSPLEKGLQAGREYAAQASADRAKLRRVAQSRSAADTQAAIDWSLVRAPRSEQTTAFWSGFMHGVREFLLDEAAKPAEEPESDGPGPGDTRESPSGS